MLWLVVLWLKIGGNGGWLCGWSRELVAMSGGAWVGELCFLEIEHRKGKGTSYDKTERDINESIRNLTCTGHVVVVTRTHHSRTDVSCECFAL